MERTLALAAVKKVGETVLVSGWVQARRDMGKLVFFDLRDRSGRLQVVGVPAELDAASQEALKSLRPEFVLALEGVVQARGPQQVNSDEPAGTIELLAKKITILNAAKTPPFELDSEERLANEELRLQYRYLDLRRARLARNLRLRAAVIKNLRDYFFSAGFLEVETPILTKGTPEGSREFLVPARLHPGKFYVLPQSPQQFKQLLMVAGVERYVQIARCFRDEDQRGDRQPEFTQLDYEMSFVTEADVMQLTEAALLQLLAAVAPEKKILTTPFPRLTYADSLAQYGSDKPDLRVHKDDPNELAFVWIVDMPLFDQSETAGRLVANHHPFTAPKSVDRAKLESAPATALAEAYDIVLNGFEIGGGSIRIHERELQNKIFEILGLSPTDITERFGHLLEALDYGAPPHGGCAWGLDRLVSILANEPNIREVIAFPKTGDARDPLMGAPSSLPSAALAEAHIKPA